MMNSTKAQLVRAKVFSASTAASLETAINTWLAAAGEKHIVGVEFDTNTGAFSAMILYVD